MQTITRNRRAIFAATAISTLMIIGGSSAPAIAHDAYHAEAPRPTTISLSETASVSAAPDLATTNIGMVTEGRTARDAMAANAAKMNGIVVAIRASGIESRDIQTTSLSLNPVYSQYRQGETRRITGYQASNQVYIRVRDLDALGQVIDDVTANGANQINGISFGLDNDDALMDEARAQAAATLRARADLYASAFDMHVLRVMTISENAARQPQPMYAERAMSMSADMAAAPPVEAGELSINLTLNVTFELQ